MIALFESFPRCTLKRDLGLGREAMLMGMAIQGAAQGRYDLTAIVITEDGSLSLVGAGDIVLAYQYDVEQDRFVDINAPRQEQGEFVPDQG